MYKFLFLICFLLAGCSSKVPAPYSVTMLDDDIYTVSVSSRIASKSALNKYMISKAARTAEQVGCSYFFAVGNDKQYFSSSNKNKLDERLNAEYGNVYVASSGTRYKVVKPGSDENTFVCTKDKPNALLPGLYFKAS